MKTSIETISPETAKRWLELNTRNRSVKAMWVTTLARVMKEGLWLLNGEPIKFAPDGALVDGQHRLLAVIKSGCTIQSLVVRGAPPDGVDRVPRTISDSFEISGQDHARIFGRAIQSIHRIKNSMLGTSESNRITVVEALDFFRTNERKLRVSLDKVGLASKALLTRETLIAWHYLFAEKNSEKADEFILLLKTGVNLTITHPVHLLRKALTEDLMATRKMKHRTKLAFVIKSWNAFVSGEPIRILKFSHVDKFPTIN